MKKYLPGILYFCSFFRLNTMHKLVFLFFLLICLPVFAQNKIPNPGFEEHDEDSVFYWKQPGIPFYHFQYKYDSLSVPHGGTCLNGICLRNNDENEYLQVKLKETLKKDQEYHVSMFVRMPNVKETQIRQIGWYFSEKEAPAKDIQAYLWLKPQLKFDLPKDTNTFQWMYFEKIYIANGTENFLKVGHFVSETEVEIYEKEKRKLDERFAELKTKDKKKRKQKDEIKFRRQVQELANKRKQIRNFSRTQFLFDDFCIAPVKADGSFEYNEPAALPEVGTTIEIRNVFFETAKSQILEKSFEELNMLAALLVSASAMQIQINGHTDNQGNELMNKKLSEERAKSVADYLKSKGIAAERLTYKGYGSSVPVASNNNEEGRMQNRRVEFTVKRNNFK